MSDSIKPEKLGEVMEALFKEYGDEVYDVVLESAKANARKATSELRQKSPGKIAKTWRHKPMKRGRVLYRETIYNTNYRLPHLLENPHVTGPGTGHYPKDPGGPTDHTGIIAGVEEKYCTKFFRDLVTKL